MRCEKVLILVNERRGRVIRQYDSQRGMRLLIVAVPFGISQLVFGHDKIGRWTDRLDSAFGELSLREHSRHSPHYLMAGMRPIFGKSRSVPQGHQRHNLHGGISIVGRGLEQAESLDSPTDSEAV